MYHAPSPKTVLHPRIITDPPPCFIVWWTYWGLIYAPSPIQHHNLPFELHLFIFVSSLKIVRFRSSMVQFSYFFSKPQACENMFTNHKWFPLLHLCTLSQNTPHSDAKQQFTYFRSKLFCYCRCSSKSTFNNKSSTTPHLLVCKKLWTPSSLSLNLTPTTFLICATEDWLMPTKVATLQVETPLLSYTKAWCFYSWDNGGIRLQTILQIAPHVNKLEPRLHNAQEILWRSHLHNAHKDVDVARVATN